MTLRISTGLRNEMLGYFGGNARYGGTLAVLTATDIAAVDGGAGVDSLTSVAGAFLTAGFSVGDSIIVIGFSGGAAGMIGPFEIMSVVAGTITVPTGSLADDAAGESVTIVAIRGGSLRDVFKRGVLKIYTGAQPADADQAVIGTLLVTITLASGAFVAGAPANGLEFGEAAGGAIAKTSGVWSGVAAATGTAGWFRLSGNPTDAGALSYTLPRIDGAIATSGAELNMSSTAVTSGATVTIDTFTITLPAA